MSMSTSTQSDRSADGPDRRPLNPANVYDRYLNHHRQVCSRCYRQIRDVDDLPVSPAWPKTIQEIATERARPHEDGEFSYTPPERNEFDLPAASQDGRVACAGCGQIDRLEKDADGEGASQQEPRTASQLKRDAARAVERLEAFGVPVHEEALFCVLTKAKASPALQFKDGTIVKRSVAFGVRKALDCGPADLERRTTVDGRVITLSSSSDGAGREE